MGRACPNLPSPFCGAASVYNKTLQVSLQKNLVKVETVFSLSQKDRGEINLLTNFFGGPIRRGPSFYYAISWQFFSKLHCVSKKLEVLPVVLRLLMYCDVKFVLKISEVT